MKKLSFIISGGGTGGHIFPAIAIANELKKEFPEASFLFVGAKDKIEMQKVPEAGFNIEGLWIAGLQRKLTLQNALFPIKLFSSLWKSFWIILKLKPNIVIGTGGFASGAVLKMAAVLGIPTVIQEQNSYPGITNKLLAKKAHKIFVAYEGLEKYFPKDKIILTGNPVRDNLSDAMVTKEDALQHFGLNPNKKTLLVLGGSLGARRINQLVADKINYFENLNIQILWQCGKLYYNEYKSFQSENCSIMAFINQMDFAYAAADYIVSRSGASSVSELCLVGKPTIFIPSPNVAEDHQTKNAEAVVSKNGALLIKESELNTKFEHVFTHLITNKELQDELSTNCKKLGFPNATRIIVSEIKKLIHNEY